MSRSDGRLYSPGCETPASRDVLAVRGCRAYVGGIGGVGAKRLFRYEENAVLKVRVVLRRIHVARDVFAGLIGQYRPSHVDRARLRCEVNIGDDVAGPAVRSVRRQRVGT